MIFYHVLSEAIAYEENPLDLNNMLLNFQYLEKLVSKVLVLQSIDQLHNVLDNFGVEVYKKQIHSLFLSKIIYEKFSMLRSF